MKKYSLVAALCRMMLALCAFLPLSAHAEEPNECISQEVYDQCTSELATTKDSLKKCQDMCPAAVQATPSADKPKEQPKKRFVPPTRRLICVSPGATLKSNMRGFKYCECSGGVPAEIVDKESPAFDPTVEKGQCVVPYEEYQKKIAELEEAHRKTCTSPDVKGDEGFLSRCEKTGKDIHEIIVWYRSLIGAKFPDGSPIPLNAVTWVELNQRIRNVEVDLNAITNAYCPTTPKCADNDLACRCKAHEETFCKENDPRAGCSGVGTSSTPAILLAGEGHIRPGGTHSFQLRVDAVWSVYSSGVSRDGFYLHGGGGLSFNKDVTRYAVAAGAGWVHDLSSQKDRGLALRLGGEYRAEPTIGPNDVHAFGGGLNLDIIPVRPLFITLGVMAGANVVALYDDDHARTDQRSDPAFFIAPGAGIGLTW